MCNFGTLYVERYGYTGCRKSLWERTEVRVTFCSGVFKDRIGLDMTMLLMCVLK